MEKDLIYEEADGIAHITLNRPQAMNALDDALRLEAINAYSCIGDFVEVGRRLAQFRQRRSGGEAQ